MRILQIKKAPPLFGCGAVRQKLDQFENHPSQVSVCNGICHDGWSILCSYRPPHLLAARPAQTIDRHTSRITRNVTEPEAEPLGGPTFQVAISGQPGRHSCEPPELLCCRVFRTARVSDISTLNQLLEYDAGCANGSIDLGERECRSRRDGTFAAVTRRCRRLPPCCQMERSWLSSYDI